MTKRSTACRQYELYGTKFRYASGPMAKRGRKPIDYRHLNQLDRECFKGFHSLCKGSDLPATKIELLSLSGYIQSTAKLLVTLRAMTVSEFWINYEFDGDNAPPLPKKEVKHVAERQARTIAGFEDEVKELKARVAAALKQVTEPEAIRGQAATYRVWQSLWQAKTATGVVRACERWDNLPSPYADRFVSAFVVRYTDQFLSMKRDARFPKSAGADDARITYLSAGLAGLIVGISPLTAIERLRKLSHSAGSPLWKEESEVCLCWRCAWRRRQERLVKAANAHERIEEHEPKRDL
jgi:hypothetical protein